MAVAGVATDAGTQLGTHRIRVGAHLGGVSLAYAEVIHQLVSFHRVALVEDVLVDCAGRAGAALLGDFLEHVAQLIVLERCGLGKERQGRAEGDGGEAQHVDLLTNGSCLTSAAIVRSQPALVA
ncbi:hypothetical protein D3C77_658800 [compost metagenome]